jgi:DNA-binding GntR family transcriptional regulator
VVRPSDEGVPYRTKQELVYRRLRDDIMRCQEEAAGLQTTLVSMDEAMRRSAYEEWSELNSRFHVAISAITGMPLLREMTERVLGQWDRVRRHYFDGVLVPRADTAQREHHELLAAMKARDLPTLEAIVRRHNRGALVDYAAFIRQHQEA